MRTRELLPMLFIGTLTALALSVGGCSSSDELGQTDQESNASRKADADKDSADAAADASSGSPDHSKSACVAKGGKCEFDDGTLFTDPCTAAGKKLTQDACGVGVVGPYVCCMEASEPVTECAQKGGTCEFDDGTSFTDPCTSTERPIGQFACGAADGGTNYCCMPKKK